MWHTIRREVSILAPFDRHLKNFDQIDRLSPLNFFQHTSCMLLLCRNKTCRNRLVPLLRGCTHHLGIQMIAVLWGIHRNLEIRHLLLL